ncbi:MAG: GntR family transcriptional regulator [Rhizobiales bacterium]|nr:GntR family transcriptional regulator [Hyphomicrobiales bacterium]
MARNARAKTSPSSRSAPKGAGKTLQALAYDLIKERLVSARYIPGQFLQESTICDDLKLGRTPVHQALHQLQQEGLLEIIPRKGIFIKVESLSEIFTALEVRALIEPYCASQCAERATLADIAELKNILNEFEKLREKSDSIRLMELDRRFHTTIARVAGNKLIVEVLRPIHERMSRLWFMPHWQFADYDMTSTEHHELLKAFERHDASAAAEAMKGHIESLRKRILATGSTL